MVNYLKNLHRKTFNQMRYTEADGGLNTILPLNLITKGIGAGHQDFEGNCIADELATVEILYDKHTTGISFFPRKIMDYPYLSGLAHLYYVGVRTFYGYACTFTD